MAIKLDTVFPTLVGRGTLKDVGPFNRKLLNEIHELADLDRAGQAWSKSHYLGGYTSYASLDNLHFRAPIFAQFAERMQPEAEAFAKAQDWAMQGLELQMTNCWMNIMPQHTYHSLHLHPHSAISGTYYVSSPKGSVSLKLEDPRMALYMNAPIRRGGSKQRMYHEINPVPGSFVLFESWLRHEVPPNQSKEPRISLSFNYSLVAPEVD